MADPGLIAAYLKELRYSSSRLADADDIAAEAEDHLLTSVEAALARGESRADAEAQALARFGSAALVARVFIEEAKRGSAVSTELTRRAGLAAMLAPLLVIIGQAGNLLIDRGAGHGLAVVLIVVGFALFVVAAFGVRKRHGGLGRLGRIAFWMFAASPVIALPFYWYAHIALAGVQLIVVTLLGVGMLRAKVLPAPAVALFTFAPVVTLLTAVALLVTGTTTIHYVTAGALAFAIGLAWVGWVMWQEPALDVRTSAQRGPLATP